MKIIATVLLAAGGWLTANHMPTTANGAHRGPADSKLNPPVRLAKFAEWAYGAPEPAVDRRCPVTPAARILGRSVS